MNDTSPSLGIPCVNCNKKCSPEELSLFQGVGVCKECYTVADLIVRRGQHELSMLMTMLKEMVRTSLVEGNLHLARGTEAPSKAEILGMIVTMKEAHERRRIHHNGRSL